MFTKKEIRGPLEGVDIAKLARVLLDNFSVPIAIREEVAIFFSKPLDLRVKIDNTGTSLIKPTRAWEGEYFQKTSDLTMGISVVDLRSVVDLLKNFGFNKCQASRADVVEFRGNDAIKFTLKLNTKVGSFFEVELKNKGRGGYNHPHEIVSDLISQLGLKVWDRDEYKLWLRKGWSQVEKEDVGTALKRNWPTIARLSRLSNNSNHSSSQSLKQILESSSNDYSRQSEIFSYFTKRALNDHRPLEFEEASQRLSLGVSFSIVIPAYDSSYSLSKTLLGIYNSKLPTSALENMEVVVVDDGTQDKSVESTVLESAKASRIKTRYVKIADNSGRSSARNVGASLATGDVLFFLDSDVVLGKNYLFEHLVRHSLFDNLVLVSFKKDIYSFEQYFGGKQLANPDRPEKFTDFRVEKEVQPDQKGIYPEPKRPMRVRPLEETNRFIEFGFRKNVGVWDLSCMVTTSNLSMRRKKFLNTGGFHRAFKGWGLEDTFLGACLIAGGNLIVPVLSTGVWHYCSKRIDKQERYASSVFQNNLATYKKLIEMPLGAVIEYKGAE